MVPVLLGSSSSIIFSKSDIGSPPATGTGTLQITLEDVNDNAPSIYPTVAMVCEDQKDVKVILGALDKDLRPNTEPFKFELSKQSGQEKVWKINRINSKTV
ncbi:UNVERIFIED_CONTAM: Cadherin-13 [Gekko kuhli]